MNPTEFRRASEAAEGWLRLVAFAVHGGRLPTDVMVDRTYRLFFPPGDGIRRPVGEEYDDVCGVLDQLADRLRANTSGRVKWRWGGGNGKPLPQYWSTAHEAAVELGRMTLQVLDIPPELPAEEHLEYGRNRMARCRVVVRLTHARANDFQEGIRRERAAVLEAWPAAGGMNGINQTLAIEPNVPGGTEPSLDAQALALFLQDKTRTKTQIATLLKRTTQAICPARCPQLDLAMKAYKESNANDRRKTKGRKGKDGTLEAYVEDE